jgi:SAM-dependent methyltransferase
MPSFEELVAEGESIPTEGWDFSWFAGRATEERPPWGYARLLSDRLGHASASLDVQTGGGEVYAEALSRAVNRPGTVRATEDWEPNLAVAKDHLARFGGEVIAAGVYDDLPFPNEAFDLVASRHPIDVRWDEMARVLTSGGTYVSQEVGPGSVHELTDFMMGPQPADDARDPRRAVAAAEGAGLRVFDLQSARLRMEFFDVAAVVHFLRKVIWIVPGFTVDEYRDRLATMHRHIEENGPFVAHSTRFLIEANKP